MEDYFYFPAALETVCNLESGSPSVILRPTVSGRDVGGGGELRRHHYLDACFRCRRMLAGNEDIFMYRGDTPFCSEDCRQRQIDADDASEMKKKKRPKQPPAARGEQPRRQRRSPRGVPVWAR
ncbi:FCS-Like Zinc finger 1-like [Oryza brachyantha]|uniref:FCS-Like Zinc finger 1-like n=1 Tax=Oryza brachyantha TaxID=4533 RepID=UPI001ADAB612|nr:FCS-Like Zinc finger 1-like [Oryza brachyantha]